VLGRFAPEEFGELPKHLERACEAILSFCTAGVQNTMNQFNS
jgi:PTH1 family peptidyl-tRNA hydrolase